MLFIYSTPLKMNFWMHQTPLPLDIAYIDESGSVREIYQLAPFDPVPTASRAPCRYALEVNAGWFEANNVRIGSRFDDSSLRKIAVSIQTDADSR